MLAFRSRRRETHGEGADPLRTLPARFRIGPYAVRPIAVRGYRPSCPNTLRANR
jgi:hypothetical protein